MKKCSTTIDTRKTAKGRFVAEVMEWINGKIYEYTTSDYDTPHAAYRDAVRRLHERHWKVLENGKTEYVES